MATMTSESAGSQSSSSVGAASRNVLSLRGHELGGDTVLVKPVWHSSTPGRIARAEEWGTASEGWKALSAHLARRPVSQSVAALLPGKSATLLWGMPVVESATPASRVPPTRELCAALDRLEHGKSWKLGTNAVEVVVAWMTETARRHGATVGLNGNAFGLECIAFARALPALAGLLPGDQWWQLVDRLFLAVEEALHGNEQSALDLSVLERQWLAAELPLVLAYVLPELKPARELARRGGQELATALRTAVAADGMPAARQWDEVSALLATWARSRILAQSLKKSGWNQESQDRYANFARQVLRLSRRDGSLALSKTEGNRASRDLLAAAFVGADRADRILATSLIAGQDLPRNVSAKSLPPPAVNNEAAGVTVLRPNWSRNSERVTVTRAGSEVRIELACGRDVLWSGVWTCEVRRNGELLVPEADAEWDEVCWTSTEDADYLELEIALPENIRVQRQIVLAREDGFLFLADAVLGVEAASLEYRGALPLGADVSFDPSTETREGYLVGRKPRGLAFPLALPEWKAQPSAGALEGTLEQTLELRAARREARCLYAPLFIDLNSRRLFRPATWRQLTVAEDRQTLSPDVAVGYRVQVRDEQWLLYRSLGKRGNRTLLGHNLVSEFLVARFKIDGDIEPLVEIE